MCIGIPMQVIRVRPGHALAQGRGETRELSTALVGPVEPGTWVLAFLDSARECISAERAAEVDALLDQLEVCLAGGPIDEPGFTLPSALSADELLQLVGPTADPVWCPASTCTK